MGISVLPEKKAIILLWLGLFTWQNICSHKQSHYYYRHKESAFYFDVSLVRFDNLDV